MKYISSLKDMVQKTHLYIYTLKTFSRIQLITINYMTSKQYYIFI